MNHKITQIFVPSAISGATSTYAMAEKTIAAFDADGNSNLGATPSTPDAFKLVFGTGTNNKYGTFKTSVIKQSNILSVVKTSPDLTVTQQVSYLGWDEASAATPVKYPVGAKAAMAEMERNYFTNNLPAVAEARYYWNPIYNEDANKFFYVPTYTAASGFTMYEITYLEDSPVGFEKKTQNTHSVIILVETGSANAAAIEVFINNLFSTQPTVNSYTTTQRDALTGMPIGTVIYNTTTGLFNVWTGSAWDDIVSA